MLSTSARLLRLAALLQSRRHWPGGELAESLEVDARTVRRDVDRLRELGYPIDASAGIGGGYALGRGADLPPLVLDDEEAVALAISLRVATASIGGLEDTAVRLLSKLDHLLPARLKRRVSALHAMTLSLRIGEPLIDAALLSTLATSCRDCIALTFSYRDHHGEATRRQVQPLRLASYGRRWYLVGWDVSRADWRTFRVDRIKPKPTIGAAFPARLPPPDVAAKIERGIAYAPFAYRITLRLQGPVNAHAGTIPTWCGLLESDGDDHSLLRVGADSIEALLAQVVMIGRGAELVEGEEWLPQLRSLLATATNTLRAGTRESRHDRTVAPTRREA